MEMEKQSAYLVSTILVSGDLKKKMTSRIEKVSAIFTKLHIEIKATQHQNKTETLPCTHNLKTNIQL